MRARLSHWLTGLAASVLLLCAQLLDPQLAEAQDVTDDAAHAAEMARLDVQIERAALLLCQIETGAAAEARWSPDGDLVCIPRPGPH